MTTQIRPIQAKDNAAVKKLVVGVLAEHGIQGEGFAGVDPELDDMCAAYAGEDAAFYVIESSGEVLGVGGFATLQGTAGEGVAELRKMYFKPALRGQGWGNELLTLIISQAKQFGFEKMYLETTPDMKAAQAMYKKHGFTHRSCRLGDTGHTGCGVFMERLL